MDISAFSADNFEVKDWINTTFKTAESQDDRDAFVSSLVMKLQLYVQQVNASLEDTSQSVLSSLPRIFRDTQLLQQEALALREKMVSVKEEISKVEKDTALSMNALERIDRLKSDLQLAKQRLHEADNWTVLANDLEEVFESGDIEAISSKLFSMQKSLSMLSNAADYEDKKLQLEGLKNRLEAITSPKLVQAFTSQTLDQSKTYVTIFTKMDRLPQLLKYYHNCLKVHLCQEWVKIQEQAQDEITVLLHTLYDKLLSSWHEQTKWCSQIFPPPFLNTLIDVYTDLLASLNISDCISQALKQHSAAMQLSLLLELKQMTRHFASSLSHALSTSAHGPADQEKLLSLAQTIYLPYVSHVASYSAYETAQLSQQVTALQTTNEDLSEAANSLSLSVSRAIEHANEANKRCKLFTDGCGYPALLKSLNLYFKQYLDRFRVCIKRLERSSSKHEDWNLFQTCLMLMQTLGELCVQLEQLEKTLVSSVVEANNRLNSPANEVFTRFSTLLLSQAGRDEFKDLIASLGEDRTILDPVVKAVHKLCADLHATTYKVIFSPIATQLSLVPRAPAWSQGHRAVNFTPDLPDFSFAPQEYITQVGQYLMTLPQHLEPFLLRDNPSLLRALRAADPQYSQGGGVSGFTDVLLGIIARGTCQMFLDQSLVLCELNFAACKQLATDIEYLGNVLEELGLSLDENLTQMSVLLRLTPEEYQTGCSGCNPRFVAAVRQMRNITSSG